MKRKQAILNGERPKVTSSNVCSVFRPSFGMWHRLNSGPNNSFFATQFGDITDKIAPADYDGDGKTDIAALRQSTGV